MAGRGALCHRCGGVRITVDGSDVVCPDCGARGRGVPLVASARPGDAVRRREGIEHLRAMRKHERRVFETAPFAPYALDERWTGLRWFGGMGSSNGVTSHLQLAFGHPFDDAATLVRIDTQAPRPIGDLSHAFIDPRLGAQGLLQQLWHATGEPLRDDVRAAAFPQRNEDALLDPVGPWDDATIPVDTTPTHFKVLESAEGVWVGIGRNLGPTISVFARRWSVADTGLERLENYEFEIYAAGSEDVARLRGQS